MNYSLPPGLIEVPFKDGGHWVSYQGRYLKSVGKILDTYYPMPAGIDPWYLTRGKMVHDATVLIDADTLDWAALDERLEPFCRAYEAFICMSHPVMELSEQIVVMPDYSYGGRLDRVIRLPGRERLILVDIKVGSGKEVRYQLQLAAYALALAGDRVGDYDLALLNLQKNGSPRLTVLDDPGSKVAEWREILANYLKEKVNG